MLSRDLGGIQQSFLDYNKALDTQGVKVVNITSFFAAINHRNLSSIKIPNLGPWDILSIIYIQLIIRLTKPTIIIAHGNRAISFVSSINKFVPLIGVAHNYNFRALKKCNYIIALTEDMKKYLAMRNFPLASIFVVPNMIELNRQFIPRTRQKEVIIGAVARLVRKKGMHILLEALSLIQHKGYNFKAVIAGDGEEKNNLLQLAKKLKLEKHVEFLGWIDEGKEQFFTDIDIFCLPSLHEPFGIILLEAMHYALPIIATKTEGPSEILRDRQDAALCEINSSGDLAEKIIYFLENPDHAIALAHSAYIRLKDNYSIKIVGVKLKEALSSINSKAVE